MTRAKPEFYMKVPLGNGEFTNGRIDYTGHPAMLGMSSVDLAAMRVLDVAANDGFWSFWAEQRGSTDVLAIDVEGFEHYDWGYGQPDTTLRRSFQGAGAANWQGGLGFKWLHDYFQSSVQRQARSVYSLDPAEDGEFDVIFNYGLLYHLRHPLLSLERCRAVCRGSMILETHAVNTLGNIPASLFYEDDVFRGITNWTGPTEACVFQWLRSAGFPHVFIADRARHTAESRLVVVACVDDLWRSMFDAVPALTYCGNEYVDSIRKSTLRTVEESHRPFSRLTTTVRKFLRFVR